MQAEILLTLKLQQRLFADPRRIALLKQIDLTGSISQGAKNAGISYKSAWDAINEMNQLSEQSLVDRATGGKGGGGAVLTRYGQRSDSVIRSVGADSTKSLRRTKRR